MFAPYAVKRPLLRWHGGKWKLAPWIIDHMPKHKTYVEPYGGVASVLLRKTRVQTEVWNDLDCELNNLFSILRSSLQAEALRMVCALTPFSRTEFIRSYEPSDDPIEQARRLIVRSFFGYGSKAATSQAVNGFRSFRCGSASPATDWLNWPDTIPLIAERMRGVVIESNPAIDVIRRYDRPDTLFYVDPPYVAKTRNLHHGCYRHEMDDADHKELISVLLNVKGMIILSGYRTNLYNDLLVGWARYSCVAYADKSAPRIECLWVSPNAKKDEKHRFFQKKIPVCGEAEEE